jgi:thiamine biosynthesis lipoprotein
MLLSSSAPHRRSTPAACRQLSAVAALALLVSCAQSDSQLRLHTFSGPTMGTQYTVKVVAEDLDDERQDHLGETIQRELDEVNAKMSHYLEDSELSRLNRWQALRISRLTDGAFDITIAPLVDAWGFGPPGRSDEPPNEQLIEMLLRRTGWELIELLPDGPAVRKLVPQLTFDLSALAKGFGVDQVAEGLEREGVRHYMVEVGGEVRTRGSNPDGTAWRIAIEKPDSAQRALQLIVPLRDLSMATSGDYRNYYEAGGRRITHALASVSVIHEECVQADALATALMVLGPEGYELAEQLGLAVYFLAREADGGFIETRTTAFSALVED